MTDQHLSNELIDAWANKYTEQEHTPRWVIRHVADEAAQWGADQQLTKDAKWLDHNILDTPHLKITPIGKTLIEAMRPKPLNLKRQALNTLKVFPTPEGQVTLDITDLITIRRALEELPND